MQSDGVFGLIAIVLAFALVIAKEKLLPGRSKQTYRCMLAKPVVQDPIVDHKRTALRRKPVPNNAGYKSGLLGRENFSSDSATAHLWALSEKTLHDHRGYIQ